ncbi:microsomal glutathione S-transferase 2 isoform X3 [Scleropages formosus]|uniref:microsomal glutathione S-transferase 2 isoform X3 n=1 Tax=Scleropages formosus TaxID=113540 RepID=UPI0010FA88EE|nr:microsomal glutathione S-transferase 2-like isoform X3 [Scleropages formosus]
MRSLKGLFVPSISVFLYRWFSAYDRDPFSHPSQNCVEAYLPFLVTLWVSGLFFHEGLAALGGLVFIFARQMYFNGYVTSAKNRLPGFYLTLAAWLTLAALGTVGILHHLLDEYLDINLRKMLFKS